MKVVWETSIGVHDSISDRKKIEFATKERIGGIGEKHKIRKQGGT